MGYKCVNTFDMCTVDSKINVEIDKQQWWGNKIMTEGKMEKKCAVDIGDKIKWTAFWKKKYILKKGKKNMGLLSGSTTSLPLYFQSVHYLCKIKPAPIPA